MDDIQVPNLPGYISNDVIKPNYSKKHLFDVLDGIPVIDKDTNQFTKPSQQKTIPTGDEFYENRKDLGDPNTKELVRTINRLPKWLAFDRSVLRFYAYIVEKVIFSNEESLRYRKFQILYYLDDDTIQINEESLENSGIDQGMYLKRQPVPADAEDRFMKWSELKVGQTIPIFKQPFHIISCDAMTREFYEKMETPLEEDGEFPIDVYSLKRDAAAERPPPNTTISGYNEALLGKTAPWQLKKAKQFLAHDRKVLRFWATWNDPQVFGRTRHFQVFYYLSDDTISISEDYPENAGTQLFPTFLSRRQLPRALPETGVALIGEDITDEVDIYTHADLRVGGYITVYGRHMLLTGCDDYTKCFFQDIHGYEDEDFEPIKEVDEEYVIPTVAPPPHNGFGTEQDSLGSVKHLVPRVPRKDYVKLLKYDNTVLRFKASLVTTHESDLDRRFVIEFFRSNDTCQIFELRRANSGFMGGKFLERRKCTNPETGKTFQAGEFFVGATLVINGWNFSMLEADESTLGHMEAESSTFKYANHDEILKKLANKLWDRRGSRTATFRLIDSNHDNFINKDEFQEMMEMYGWRLNAHELLTIWRCYDTNGDGKITANRFFTVLESYKHGNKAQ